MQTSSLVLGAALVLACAARGVCVSETAELQIRAHVGVRNAKERAADKAQVREIEVTDECVRVRDLVPAGLAEGNSAELDRPVIAGLRPGERRLLTPAEIVLRLTEIGCDPESRGWQFTRAVAVRRASQVIAAEKIAAAGEEAIRKQLVLYPGDEVRVTPVNHPKAMLSPVGVVTLEAAVRRPALRGGLWVAEVIGRAGPELAFECTIRYRVRLSGDVVVARRRIRRDQVLGEADVVVEKRELTTLSGVPLRSPAEVTGRRAARAGSAGTVLTTGWTELIPAVRRGELITATASVGGVRASAQLLACSDGRVGEAIAARSPLQRRGILVRVTGPGQAEVMVRP